MARTKDWQRLQLHGPHLVIGAWPSEEGRCIDEVTQVHTNAGKRTKPASDISGARWQSGLLPFHELLNWYGGSRTFLFPTKFMFDSALNPIPYKTHRKALCFTPVCLTLATQAARLSPTDAAAANPYRGRVWFPLSPQILSYYNKTAL